ncbi:MAG: hypothetical protein WCA85_25665 [Paraburkholderia sp.]|uniref:hypothetical protein n=1 Tax=Paraburkholderia sp. TaxID=1926495 RepID=UPI003C57E350
MVEIPLTQGKTALIDDEDLELVSKRKWYAEKSRDGRRWYAATSVRTPEGKKTTIKMHRYIKGITDRKIDCDHRDLNGLNNQKLNLRVCTRAQNMQNTPVKSNSSSGLKGIVLHKASGLWMARIRSEGKQLCLGYFYTPDGAHSAYCKAAAELHGEFARTS